MPDLTERELDAYLWFMLFTDPATATPIADIPLLSSTGDGMLLVIEKMRELGYEFSCGTTDIGWHAWFPPSRFTIQIITDDSPAPAPLRDGQAWDDSLPRAVALAAKAALEA